MTTAAQTLHPELTLMLLADARLPTSGHTQSAGLEPALLGGLAGDQVLDYCRARLRTVTLTESATAVVCLAQANVRPCIATVESVDRAWAARTPSPALRDASRALGRAYRRLALGLWPGEKPVVLLQEILRPPRPVVVGLVGAAAGLGAESVARLVAYDDMQSVLSASLKLLPGDPVEVARGLLSLASEIDAVVERVVELVDPREIPAWSAPLIEIWAERHASADRRLFSA